MIDIGKLYCAGRSTGDGLRYGTEADYDSHGNAPHRREISASQRRPIVVWSTTRSCNLNCVHCYTDSTNQGYSGELSTDEGLSLIDDLAHEEGPLRAHRARLRKGDTPGHLHQRHAHRPRGRQVHQGFRRGLRGDKP